MLATGPATGRAAEGEASSVATDTNAQDSLRASLLLQEQLHNIQQQIDRNRREGDVVAAKHAEILASRLEELEKSMIRQQSGQLDALQTSNRALLLIGGTFGAIAVVMLAMGYFQWRTIQRLTALPALSASSVSAGSSPMLKDPAQLAGSLAEASNLRLLGTLDRLERRLLHLEHSTQASLGNGTTETTSATTGANGLRRAGGKALAAPQSEQAIQMEQLMDKGQALVDQGEYTEALTCFEEALTLGPKNAELLVKKGTTLERLQKPDDAIECYNQAIAADETFTIAYLHKGGLFNRLERFGEALECYKMALKTQK
jgi:tetratricopeptide (TPR) repeat protein